MTDIHARMLAKPAFVVTPIKKNGITNAVIPEGCPKFIYFGF
ncbi:hypothetical protein [Microcystis sp. LEGE 08355]|jgi:hypothetical protein|nr:hypothetical protein [Microcystis sp. LEGE 08355]